MDQLHDISAARERLGGIGRSLCFELVRTGELRSVKVGRRRMIPESAIADYIARHLESRPKVRA